MTTKSFNQQFDEHGAWRRDFALKLKSLSDWLRDQDLLDSGVQERLQRLEQLMRSDKVMVAFVAEFSRGKSELINALFFAGYKRRIMPASAGRTTMCPTELGWDAEVPPCLRLLPIETRLQPHPLAEWRLTPEKWTRIDLDVNDASGLAESLRKVSEVVRVTVEEAKALGFWHEDRPQDNPPIGADNKVEVPRWRHALINVAHPLLKQGLVILDTPGLNAIGAEPELTVSLIPQAHAVLFILAADTGVTKSDMAVWKEHLITERTDSRFVVLNKIDTMWDALSTPAQIQAQIESQRTQTADMLALPKDQVLAVSAQKGLVAKVNNDINLLSASKLPHLEAVLGQGVMAQRERILRGSVSAGVLDLQTEAHRVINIRRRDLADQMLELKGLRGKNDTVIRHMRERVIAEAAEFDKGGARIHAVRSVHMKLLRDVFDLLGNSKLRAEMKLLQDALRKPGIKLGVSGIYKDTFERMQANLMQAQTLSSEIHKMLQASFKQLNAEFGFSLVAPDVPDLLRFDHDLGVVQQSHQQYLGMGNMFRLTQPEFVDRLVRALATRLRVVFETALGEIELWNKSAAAQLDAQLRERRKNYRRRIDSIERIQEAATNLDERIDEIKSHERNLNEVDAALKSFAAHLTIPVAAH
jgi:hypothetical protein